MESFINIFSGVAILTVVGFSIKTYVDTNQKIDRNYKRLDEVKDEVEARTVRKDICQLIHEQQMQKNQETADDIAEIKADVKALLIAVKNNGK